MKRILPILIFFCSSLTLTAQTVPDFTLTDINGQEFRLHETLAKGQAVVLDFFASWCGPCALSSVELEDFYDANGNGLENLEIYSITIEEDDDVDAVNAIPWAGGHYPTFAYDSKNRDIYNFYADIYNNVGSIPFFVFICPNVNDPGESTLIRGDIGYQGGMFSFQYQIGLNNCASATSVTTVEGLNDFRVFPNPASESLNIMIAADRSIEGDLIVYNTMGQELQRIRQAQLNAGNQSFEVDVNTLNNGIYYLSYQSTDGAVVSKKFSVSH